MTKPALLRLLVVIMIMFILILPEYFKTSKASIMNDSMEMKAENFLPLHVIFNFTVVPVVEDLGGYDTTCVVKLHLTNSTAGKDLTEATLLNSSHRSVQSLKSCNQVSLQLEMETGNSTCTMKITWYVLILLVFIFLIIFTVHKIFQENGRVQTWQNRRYKPASTVLKGNDSEKLRRVLNIQVISGATKQRGPSTFTGAKEALPPISELEHFFYSESERSIYATSIHPRHYIPGWNLILDFKLHANGCFCQRVNLLRKSKE
ncbi:transmembrane protein 156 [Trichosurus vulpecula]|uniref:transmembrane protein 156 n=1 Tax=Trichosurus vulpecula TaxID=9337 RepID=UPI00186ACC15|nr:transmembrane protein 156 [Trichosurus vulpecula]